MYVLYIRSLDEENGQLAIELDSTLGRSAGCRSRIAWSSVHRAV
jgi:hypothetical protein